jgi:DNA-binding NarL/FixJ family response regulator
MTTAMKKHELRHVAVAVLDANPILGEAMVQHFSSSKYFGRDDVISLTWERARDLAHIRPSILVLDPAQPPNGLEDLVAELRASVPDLQMVAYSSAPSVDLARACMGLGFRAFVPKSAESTQLTGALTVVANGGMYVDKQFAECLLPAPAQPPEPQGTGQLSQREEAILRRISLGLSHKQIGTELGLSHKTVDTYRARGMRKLGLADRGELVRYALKQGWLE